MDELRGHSSRTVLKEGLTDHAGPLFHRLTFPATPRYYIETIDELQAHLTAPQENWLGVGACAG